MMRLLYLTTGDENSEVLAALLAAADAIGWTVIRSEDGYIAEHSTIRTLAREASGAGILVAHVERRSQHLLDGIQLAHELNVPVLLISSAPECVPVVLRAERIVTYASGSIDRDRLAHTLTEQIADAGLRNGDEFPPTLGAGFTRIHLRQTEATGRKRLGVGERGPDDTRIEYGNPEQGFHRTVGALLSSVEGWEVRDAPADREEVTPDFVVWNHISQSNVVILGNPVAVEVRAGPVTAEVVMNIGQAAATKGLKGVIVITEMRLKKRLREDVIRAGGSTAATVVVIDETDLRQIRKGRRDFLDQVEKRLTELCQS